MVTITTTVRKITILDSLEEIATLLQGGYPIIGVREVDEKRKCIGINPDDYIKTYVFVNQISDVSEC